MIGEISPEPLGCFQVVKMQTGEANAILDVILFPLRVNKRADHWPERGQRAILWFEPEGAARLVRERDLARMIVRFRPSQPSTQQDE